jgi:hypothetical protein
MPTSSGTCAARLFAFFCASLEVPLPRIPMRYFVRLAAATPSSAICRFHVCTSQTLKLEGAGSAAMYLHSMCTGSQGVPTNLLLQWNH